MTSHGRRKEKRGDPFKMLLEEALKRQRVMTMDNFTEILRWIPTGDASSSSSHSRGTNTFEVEVKFDIPIFEVLIDVVAVDKWLNLLEGYFSAHDFTNRENITFALLKATPYVKD